MCYHSQGGFTHDEVYGMPVYLRHFYFKELQAFKEEEKKEHDKQNQKMKSKSAGLRR